MIMKLVNNGFLMNNICPHSNGSDFCRKCCHAMIKQASEEDMQNWHKRTTKENLSRSMWRKIGLSLSFAFLLIFLALAHIHNSMIILSVGFSISIALAYFSWQIKQIIPMIPIVDYRKLRGSTDHKDQLICIHCGSNKNYLVHGTYHDQHSVMVVCSECKEYLCCERTY